VYSRVILYQRIKKILENKIRKISTTKTKKNSAYHVATRDWIKGDLVKVNDYDITGLPSSYYGLISDEPVSEAQLKFWPALNVYCLFDGLLRPVELYKLELVSSAK